MISCAFLEQSGKWRLPAITAGLLLALAPALVLVFVATGSTATSFSIVLRSNFASTLGHSLAVAVCVALLALLVGLPTGVLAGLYDFPLRRLLLATLALPLLIPSFLSAIGLSMLRTALGLPGDSFLSGFTGTVLAFTPFALPLIVFITLASVRGITRSQMDVARLAGGERHLVHCVIRSVLPIAALTGLLASVFTLSDPGPWPDSRLRWRSIEHSRELRFAIRLRAGLAAMSDPGAAYCSHHDWRRRFWHVT